MSNYNVKSDSSTNLIEKLVFVNRVSKATTGGDRAAFLVIMVVGDGKQMAGFGTGKALDVSAARSKAIEEAKKNMIKIPLKEARTLYHDFKVKYCSTKIVLRSAPEGTGIIANEVVRSVCECFGIKDVVVKVICSTQKLNIVRALFKALKNIESPKSVASRRDQRINVIVHNRNINNKKVTDSNEEK